MPLFLYAFAESLLFHLRFCCSWKHTSYTELLCGKRRQPWNQQHVGSLSMERAGHSSPSASRLGAASVQSPHHAQQFEQKLGQAPGLCRTGHSGHSSVAVDRTESRTHSTAMSPRRPCCLQHLEKPSTFPSHTSESSCSNFSPARDGSRSSQRTADHLRVLG